jgi:hypothetical protein
MELNTNIKKSVFKNSLFRNLTECLYKLKIVCALLLPSFFSIDLLAQIPSIDGSPAEWPAVLNSASNTKKAFKHDPFQVLHVDDQWTGGSSDADFHPNTDWHWVAGNANDKGDIANAGAVLIGKVLYFMGDRAAINGDAQIGFWFFKDNVQPLLDGSGKFSGDHTNGDLLVISNFTGGGGHAAPTIYEWQGKTATSPGAAVLVRDPTHPNPSVPADLTTNGSKIASPNGTSVLGDTWMFQAKGDNADHDYLTNLFFEGYVDLTNIPEASCFQRFLLETRNSQSLSASLQDLAAGAFSGVPNPPIVTPGSACVGNPVTVSASCSGTSVRWYANASGGSPLGTADGVSQDGNSLTKTGLATGTYTFYASCADGDCESSRVSVTATVFANPAVDGQVTIEPGVTQVAIGTPPVPIEDVYQIKLSTTNVAHLFVASPVAGTTYTWTRINCGTGTPFAGDAATSFTDNGNGTASLTINSTANLANAYCFRVTASVDHGGGVICTASDDVEIRPLATSILCHLSGPTTVCAGSTNSTYILDGDLNTVADGLDPDFNYVWSISGNGTINNPDAGLTTKSGVNSITVTAGATAGSYTVTLTITGKNNSLQDPGPCTATAAVTLVTLSLDKTNVTCHGGNNGTVTATFGGGTAPYKIQINSGTYVNPATSPYTFQNLTAANYTVHVVDANNCEASSSVTVGEPDALTLSLDKADVSCRGSDGSVTATFAGGSGSYEANIDGGGFAAATSPKTFGGLSAGSHTVVVRDANDHDCSISRSITVNNPTSCDHLFPTQTTCCNYVGGNTSTFVQQRICYSVASGKVSQSVNPGVFFYYGDFTPNFSGNATIVVQQAKNNTKLALFSATNSTNVRVTDGFCNSVGVTSINISNLAGIIITMPVVSGTKYVVSVKYDSKSIVGSDAGGGPTVVYTFGMSVNGTPAANSTGQLTVATCSSSTTGTPSGTCPSAPITLARMAPKDASIVNGITVSTYPNPYTDKVKFVIQSPVSGKGTLELYNLLGQKIHTVYEGQVFAGHDQSVEYIVPASQRTNLIYIMKVNDRQITGKLLNNK